MGKEHHRVNIGGNVEDPGWNAGMSLSLVATGEGGKEFLFFE